MKISVPRPVSVDSNILNILRRASQVVSLCCVIASLVLVFVLASILLRWSIVLRVGYKLSATLHRNFSGHQLISLKKSPLLPAHPVQGGIFSSSLNPQGFYNEAAPAYPVQGGIFSRNQLMVTEPHSHLPTSKCSKIMIFWK